MTNIQITGAIMHMTGRRIEQFSKDEGLPHAVVYRVINGTSKNERVRQAIARTIGKKVSEIWPDQAKEGK